jgi:hypothetical protein
VCLNSYLKLKADRTERSSVNGRSGRTWSRSNRFQNFYESKNRNGFGNAKNGKELHMLSIHLSRRLKVLSLLLFSFLAVSGFFVSPPCHGACEFLSADFASGADWTASSHGDWTLSSEMLDVQNIAADSLPHAGVDFSPAGFFSVDTFFRGW